MKSQQKEQIKNNLINPGECRDRGVPALNSGKPYSRCGIWGGLLGYDPRPVVVRMGKIRNAYGRGKEADSAYSLATWAYKAMDWAFPTAVGAVVTWAATYRDWIWNDHGMFGAVVAGLIGALMASVVILLSGYGMAAWRGSPEEIEEEIEEGETSPVPTSTTKTRPPLPAQYKTAGHRERLGEIFYEFKMTLNQEIRPLTTKGHQLVSTWENKKGGTIDANAFIQTNRAALADIVKMAEDAELKIYAVPFQKHPAYLDLLNDITLKDRNVQREWPIVQFARATQAFNKALLAHHAITTANENAAAGMVTLINYPQHELQDAIHKLDGWADATNQTITAMEQELGR